MEAKSLKLIPLKDDGTPDWDAEPIDMKSFSEMEFSYEPDIYPVGDMEFKKITSTTTTLTATFEVSQEYMIQLKRILGEK